MKSRYEKLMEQSAQLKAKVKRLVAHGMSQTEVAKKVGVTKQRVSQILKGH